MPGCTGAHGAATRTRCLPAASAAMTASATRDTADAVVVGGGTIGAWCAWFLRRAGLAVVLVERASLGRGASSRAAGMVRAQGGTAWTVRLGMWTQGFYRSQREEIGVDSGFVPTGYLMPVFDEAQVDAGRARVAMQRSLGLDVAWLSVDEADALLPAMATRMHVGGSYAPGDGYVDPPRNVAAYTAACVRDGVDVREGTEFVGLRTAGGEVRGVVTSRGEIASEGRPHRRARARLRRRARRDANLRGCRPAPGRGHRTAPVARARADPDGLRPRRGHVLAARGRRRPLRD